MLDNLSVYDSRAVNADLNMARCESLYFADHCLDACESLPAGSTMAIQGCDRRFEITSRVYRTLEF